MQEHKSDRALQLKMENAQLTRAEGSLRARCRQLQEAASASEAAIRQLEADSIAKQEVAEQNKHQVSLTSFATLLQGWRAVRGSLCLGPSRKGPEAPRKPWHSTWHGTLHADYRTPFLLRILPYTTTR